MKSKLLLVIFVSILSKSVVFAQDTKFQTRECINANIQMAEQIVSQFQGKEMARIYNLVDPVAQVVQNKIESQFPFPHPPNVLEVLTDGELKYKNGEKLPPHYKKMLEEEVANVGIPPLSYAGVVTEIHHLYNGKKTYKQLDHGLLLNFDGYSYFYLDAAPSARFYHALVPINFYEGKDRKLRVQSYEIIGLTFFAGGGNQIHGFKVHYSVPGKEPQNVFLSDYLEEFGPCPIDMNSNEAERALQKFYENFFGREGN